MSGSRLVFTKTALDALSPPASGRATYHDSRTPGLILRVTPGGAKSFYWYRKLAGRPVRLLIGKFPATTVEQARKACEKLSGEVVSGKDPQAERRAVRGEMSLADLWANWKVYA